MVKLIFESTQRSDVDTKLFLQKNIHNEIYIELSNGKLGDYHICLDVNSAIKLVKILKSEIGKAKWEVENGK